MTGFEEDIAAVHSIKAIPTILDIVCRATGMRFAAVARVTEEHWIACSVRDDIEFGLQPGGELSLSTTICHEIRQHGEAVVIDSVADDPFYADHHTPRLYGLQSYISMPIRLSDGTFFGTLCAIDPDPRTLNTPETIAMFKMFADVIGFHLSAVDRVHLVEANLKNERNAATLREQFIAVLGHDLRNPLAAIDGGMRMLVKTPLNDKARTIVGMVQGAVVRMTGLIENVLDFARGRLGGGLSLNRAKTAAVEPMLRQVVAELQASAPDRAIEAVFQIPDPLTCDRVRIGQLASNLLGNALTHGASSEPIRLNAATAEGWFELSVANSGEPIPAPMMPHIFEPFTRGSLRPNLEGLGLGLFICNEIAKAHGGALTATSTVAETRFTFRMPAGE
jgi:signal transduction histidine kinase